ncbi:hypothetical protein AB0J57_32300 [Streptomyces sp. NPDC049837]|uniref:hypothetical protein n=1 Tax=Streptomyces sp. NPDC049837 TaxID=3155277 RepID=UPI00343D8CB1
MRTTTGGFAAPKDAADAIVDEILRRRIATDDARRQHKRLRQTQPKSPWFDEATGYEVRRFEADMEERALLLALAHLLDGGDAEGFVTESVQRRYLAATIPVAGTSQIVVSREGFALQPS